MGICQSTKEKGPIAPTANNPALTPKKVETAADVIVSRADFIQRNTGKFRDFYQLGQMLGQGSFGEVRKCLSRAG